MRRHKHHSGFSLVEMMITVGLVSLVGLSFAAAFKMMSGAKASADLSVGKWSSMAVVGTNFSKLAASAKFSTSFLHLPVQTTCSSDSSSCLRLSDGTSFTNAAAGAIPQSQVEFYADADANLKDTMRILKRLAATDTKYTAGDMMSVSRAPSSQNQLQVTFPLIDATSPPFPMIIQKDPTQFVIPNYSAQSDAVPGTWLFIKLAAGLPIAGSGLKHELLAFYSAENPRVYTIQLVMDAKDCSSNMSLCQATVGPANAGDVAPTDAVVKIAPIDSSHDLANLQAYLPPTCSPGSPGCWSTDFSALGAFPSISTTVTEAGLDYFAAINFDPRKLLHYFHSSGIAGNLSVAPIQLVSYRIVGKSLVRDVYHYESAPGSDRNSVLGDLPGAVMFSRALGSGDIQLTQFKNVAGDPPFKHITQVMTGTSRGLASSDASMNRKTVIYPKECDMTFAMTPYCGDGDVATYAAAHPNEAFLSGTATDVKLVLGYWIEPSGSAPVGPTAQNWFAVGYEDKAPIGTPHVGLKQVNSNDRKSGSKLLKAEVDRLVGLSGYLNPSQSYDLYSVAMVCENWDDSQGVTADPDYDSYTTGAQVCSAPVPVNPVPDDYGVPSGSVTCPSPTISCSGGYYSYSYSTDAMGTTTCSTSIVCPSSVPTTGTPVPDPGTGWGGSCFEAGTQITMADGSLKKIEDVEVGDLAVSYDEMTGDVIEQPVVDTLHHEWKWEQMYHIRLENGQTLDVNQVHGLYVHELGDYAKVKFIAPQFWAGQKLSLVDESGRPVAILSITAEKRWTHLYNLHMQGVHGGTKAHYWGRGHNYFANGILAHNMNMNVPDKQ